MKTWSTLTFIMLSYAVLAISISRAQANQQVLVEFLYYDVCSYCPGLEVYYQAYVHNSKVVYNIERDYLGTVRVQRIDWTSSEGIEKINAYKLEPTDWNTIVVNGEAILKGGDQFVEEARLRQIIDYYLALKHDVAISDVTISSRSLSKGDILNMSITVRNKGKQPESFSIIVSFNSTDIEKLYIELLEPGATRTVYLPVNTARINEGRYILTIYAVPVENEVNTKDNLFNAGMFEIRTQDAEPPYMRDIAVLEVIPSKRLTSSKEQINVTVLVKNLGTMAENFTLKIFLDGSSIIEKCVYLDPDSSSPKVFTVDLAGLTPGSYTIKAMVELEEDLNWGNNECSFTINVLNVADEIDKLYFAGHVLLAFTFGFFETFSPCLLVLLSFLVGYTLSEKLSFKEGFTKILTFGLGFLSAALLTSTLAIFLFFITSLQKTITIVVCISAILLGLNAIGVNVTVLFKKPQENGTKTLVQKMAKRYSKTYAGIIVIGFLFYFLDPCLAPFFFAIIPLILNVNFAPIVLAFCLGVLLPFVLIGVVTGSLSRLVRISYKHRSKLRFVSGLILIGYSAYLIFSHIFRHFY